MVGLQFGGMLAGAVVTETVFSVPGVGRLVVSAILSKDYPLVQGCILFLATVYLPSTSRSTSPMRGSIRASGIRAEPRRMGTTVQPANCRPHLSPSSRPFRVARVRLAAALPAQQGSDGRVRDAARLDRHRAAGRAHRALRSLRNTRHGAPGAISGVLVRHGSPRTRCLQPRACGLADLAPARLHQRHAREPFPASCWVLSRAIGADGGTR